MRTPALVPVLAAAVLAGAVSLASCTVPAEPEPSGAPLASGAQGVSPSALGASSSSSAAPHAATGPVGPDSVEGTVVRFSGGGTSVDVTIGADTPTTRDFVSLLPFTMQLEEYAGREKIGDPPRELDVQGTPGSDPEDGDLIYFTPWGNLGFYYDTSGVGYSDATPHLGTYQASEEELSALEGQQVSVEVVG